MFLIEVIPIARGIGAETLSYFSAVSIDTGSLVNVPIRKKTVSALVVASRDARDARLEIRASEFAMKKVSEFKAARFLSPSFIKAVAETARFSASSLGSVLGALVPKSVIDTSPSLKIKNETPKVRRNGTFDRLAIQSDDEERFANYRTLIREEFANVRSVFLCVPTAEDAKRAAFILSKGIEEYTHALYGSLPKKKFRECVRRIFSDDHPALIIGTGSYLCLCRPDTGTIIIENESARSFKMQTRPFLDIRFFAEALAKESGIRFIVGDILLRVETIFRFKQGEFAELAPLKFRSLSSAASTVVDMRAFKRGAGQKFEVLSPALEGLIRKSRNDNRNLFLFVARRGLSSQTVCGDCGAAVLCSRCRSPITLHHERRDSKKNVFLCHGCGETRSSEERCAVCRSWKLMPLGVGLELVEQELRLKFPDAKIFRIDRDATATAQHAAKAAAAFAASPGAILLGTETALAHLDSKVDNSAVVSLDSFFSLPDFRIHERILHLLLKIRSLTESSFLVQTRLPDERVLDRALKGNLAEFYRDEIAEREHFRYPPFTTLLKISLAGKRALVVREMEKMKNYFAPVPAELFPAFIEESRGLFTMHALVRPYRGSWPDRELLKKLLALPPQFRVDVEPETLL